MNSDLERIIECTPEWYRILHTLLRGDELHRAEGLPDSPENLCLWTAFHQRRLVFVPREPPVGAW